jgi:serine/threonine protein kinase
VIAPIGAGGMGEVYKARDTRLNRDLAVKVLPESLAGDAEALSRFEREAKSVAALSHPNILAIDSILCERFPVIRSCSRRSFQRKRRSRSLG